MITIRGQQTTLAEYFTGREIRYFNIVADNTAVGARFRNSILIWHHFEEKYKCQKVLYHYAEEYFHGNNEFKRALVKACPRKYTTAANHREYAMSEMSAEECQANKR